jgi:hypothetical protein
VKWLIARWAAFLAWLVSWLSPPRPKPFRLQQVQGSLPPRLENNVLYLVEDDGYLEQAAMVCPCGCKATLQMNLLPDERPCWTVTQHLDGTPSLHPSVWRKIGCKSHFWLRAGQVHWCR